MSATRGFTLIECLIALLILAITLASSSRAISVAIDNVRDSYIQEVAGWVADNQINTYRATNTCPPLGIYNTKVTMANIDFLVHINTTSTTNPTFRKVEITINQAKHPNYIIFNTVNFLAQF